MKTHSNTISFLFKFMAILFLFISISYSAEAETITINGSDPITVTNGIYQLENYNGIITIGKTATEVTVVGSVYLHVDTSIVVEGGRTGLLSLTIENLNITAPEGNSGIDFENAGNYEHVLYISGDNTIVGRQWKAGIHVPIGVKLSIDKSPGLENDEGKVSVVGGPWGAGIGGGASREGGTITIKGGTITSTGGDYGAGIGGGYSAAGGTITIEDGMIITTGGLNGAGIGGGYSAAGGSITIEDGMITANGGPTGAAIGGGANGEGGNISIKDGTITATGGYGGAGIGGGYSAAGGTIIIEKATLNAMGGSEGAGIGGGSGGDGGSITIISGMITATGGNYGAGIGGGFWRSGGNIVIDGNPTVIATKGNSINLDVGENIIRIVVTAQAGNKMTYTVIVTRAPSNNANLGGLSLSTGTLDPDFTPDVTNYTVNVGNGITNILARCG